MKRNTLTGASPQLETTWAGINAALAGLGNRVDVVVVYGAEFKGNAVDREGSEDESTLRDVAAAIPIAFRTPSSLTGKGVLATLLEGNSIGNSDVGILLSPGVDASFLKDNSFTSVGEPLRDEGTNTIDW